MSKPIRIRVAGILVKDGQILLVRHEKDGRSYWLLPGGGVEFGETLEQAVVREFKEEVGLDIEVGKLVLVHDSIPPDHHRQVLNVYFLVTSQGGQIQVGADAVLKDAAFHRLDGFLDLTVRPDVKQEIWAGLSGGWEGKPLYLGNEWKA